MEKYSLVEVVGSNYVSTFKNEFDDGEFLPPKLKAVSFGTWYYEQTDTNYANYAAYRPSVMEIPGAFNQWSGFLWSRKELRPYNNFEYIRKFITHIRFAICSSEEECCQLLRRFATWIQLPEMKQAILPLICGPEGTGKSIIFLEFFKTFMTQAFVCISKSTDAMGDFTGTLENRSLVVFDEAKLEKKDLETLKNLITNSTWRKRKLFQEAEYLQSFHNFVFISNKPNESIRIDGIARRWEGYWADPAPLLKQKTMMEIYDGSQIDYLTGNSGLLVLLRHEEFQKTLANFLYNMDLSDWNPTQPLISPVIGSILTVNLDEFEAWVHDWLIKEKENDWIEIRKLPDLNDFCAWYSEFKINRGDKAYKISEKWMKNELEKVFSLSLFPPNKRLNLFNLNNDPNGLLRAFYKKHPAIELSDHNGNFTALKEDHIKPFNNVDLFDDWNWLPTPWQEKRAGSEVPVFIEKLIANSENPNYIPAISRREVNRDHQNLLDIY